MRARLLPLSLAVGVVALGLVGSVPAGTSGASPSAPAAASGGTVCSNASVQADLVQPGQLTVATDSPAYSPWFSKNRPSDGKGYESAVTYEVAKLLGFGKSKVKWVVEPFDASYQPGQKRFDFDINEISITPARAKAVTFSIGYYDVTQALVVLKTSPIVTKHTPAALKTYLYGDQIGTTSLQFIEQKIDPDKRPAVFQTLNDVKSALQAHTITAFVTDTPTAQYIAATEIPHSEMLAQFPSSTEQYGLLMSKGDKLVTCVNRALRRMKKDGFLKRASEKYLGLYNKVPTIKP